MKYIAGFFASLSFILFVGFLYTSNKMINLEEEKARLETQLEVSISNYENCMKEYEIEKENNKNAQISSSKIIKTLRLEVSKLNNIPVMDCYNSSMPAEYRKLLEQLK